MFFFFFSLKSKRNSNRKPGASTFSVTDLLSEFRTILFTGNDKPYWITAISTHRAVFDLLLTRVKLFFDGEWKVFESESTFCRWTLQLETNADFPIQVLHVKRRNDLIGQPLDRFDWKLSRLRENVKFWLLFSFSSIFFFYLEYFTIIAKNQKALKKENTHTIYKSVTLHEQQVSLFCKLPLLDILKWTNLTSEFTAYKKVLQCLPGFCKVVLTNKRYTSKGLIIYINFVRFRCVIRRSLKNCDIVY